MDKMAISKEKYIAVVLVVLVLLVRGGCQEVDDEHEFGYEAGEKGPSHWGDLKEEWQACGRGDQQSPIDLLNKKVHVYPDNGNLRRNYRAANASLRNRGHDIMVKWAEGAGTIEKDGTNFTLMQCHWHSPSEHTVNGQRYPLELHMLHMTHDNLTAVVGILYKYGRRDTFLAELMNEIASIGDMETTEEELGIVDPRHIKLGSRKYYRYVGSLTTPPCTEGVIWTIVKKVRTVSRQQVRALIHSVHDDFAQNARPTQHTNGRIIQLYNPRSTPESL
eukprot:Gb_11566 [translate_table: standard]